MATPPIAPNPKAAPEDQLASKYITETGRASTSRSIHRKGLEIEAQPISIKELLAQLDGVFPIHRAVVEEGIISVQ